MSDFDGHIEIDKCLGIVQFNTDINCTGWIKTGINTGIYSKDNISAELSINSDWLIKSDKNIRSNLSIVAGNVIAKSDIISMDLIAKTSIKANNIFCDGDIITTNNNSTLISTRNAILFKRSIKTKTLIAKEIINRNDKPSIIEAESIIAAALNTRNCKITCSKFDFPGNDNQYFGGNLIAPDHVLEK